MATIKEIAVKAGVSPTTVSNVLHGRTAKVSAAKLKKVQDLIAAENYTPNMGATLLARKISRIIGVIVFMDPRSNETIFQDPFTGAMIGALEREIQKNGYFMMLYATDQPESVLKLIQNWKLDGLLIFWIEADICSIIRKNTSIPLVFIDCYFNDDGLLYHNVGLNDRQGSYEMTWYLLKMGHVSIAFLADRENPIGGDRERLEGFRQALKDGGLSGGTSGFVALSKDSTKRKTVYESLCKPDVPFTALFFAADYYAVEALSFFQRRGIPIPDRFSIAGFDDNMYARVVNPPLTTVYQDIEQRGVVAVDMLMKLIQNEPVKEADIRLPVRLILRDSVAKTVSG